MTVAGYNENYMYFFVDRSDMRPFIPRTALRVLDVGCDQGGFASTLRATIPDAHIVGIEPVAAAAERAAALYDEVHVGTFPEALPEGQVFDAIFFLDVLEHLPDPWATLTEAVAHLSRDGVVVASIPNIQYLPVAANLLFRGRFEYADYGVLDRTHLRFFTARTIREMFIAAGLDIVNLQGMAAFPTRRRHMPFRVLRPLMGGTKWRQYAVVARASLDGTVSP